MHKSVGAVIKNEKSEILMMDRKNYPYGWACPAGHVDEGEKPEDALVREVREETGIEVEEYELLIHEFVEWNECAQGVRGHDWFVFKVTKWNGDVKKEDKEAKEISWIKPGEVKNLELEPVWEHWLRDSIIADLNPVKPLCGNGAGAD